MATATNTVLIDVVSLGTALQVPPSAESALQNADLVIGAERHLAAVDCGAAKTALYPSPFSAMATLFNADAPRRVVVLASGDALFFGVGSWLIRNVEKSRLRFHPNVTTVQSACARVGRPWQDICFLSLHGRPRSRLRAVASVGKVLAVFTDSDNTPNIIARELLEVGFADSKLHLFEAIDTEQERVRTFAADELANSADEFNSLNLLIIDVAGSGGLLPAFPGIPDAVFAAAGDTMFTKREVRLAALSRLALTAGEVGWDIGAGSGGIALEWARWSPQAKVYAIERDEKRRAFFASNCARFGDHGNLQLIAGQAPQVLHDLPDPSAVYVGGSGGHLSAVLDICWQRLVPGGRLVAAGVTMETRAELQNRHWPAAVAFTDISISHAAPLGAQTTMRAQLPVLLASVQKSQLDQEPGQGKLDE